MASATAIQRIQVAIWVFVYGGILVLGIGLMAVRNDAVVGGSLIGVGAAAVLTGVVLIWVRARLRDDSSPHRKPTP